MNTDIFEGNWKQIKGSIKSSFAKLTDDDVAELEGNGDKLIGRLQERYGWAQQEAAAKVNDFLEGLKTN
jgi:uncharacterized protein YjbJ (UPF0337 family)